MPKITLTNNAAINIDVTSADGNATLNKYLKSALTLKPAEALDGILNQPVKDLNPSGFPITLTTTGSASFAVKQTTLGVSLDLSGAIGLAQKDDKDGFLKKLQLPAAPDSSGIVSVGLKAKVTVSPLATSGDFTFGLAAGTTASLTAYHVCGANETVKDGVTSAAKSLTIPHDLSDLNSIASGAICEIGGETSIKFSASAVYSFFNAPLVSAAIPNLPSFDIKAVGSGTLAASATHKSGHTLTIAKLDSGLLHLSVSLKTTDDLEASLTLSTGITAKIGDTDALGFLLGLINPNSAAMADDLAKQMPDADKFKADIKTAVDSALSNSLAASLKAALDTSETKNRLFLFEIDPAKLDGTSGPALEEALTGDFTALTRDKAVFKGIRLLDSALTITNDTTHSLTLHLLGIFNATSIHEFVKTSKFNYVTGSNEIVLSDKRIDIGINNLTPEKLRTLLAKQVTLTLPASANTPAAATPITVSYLYRKASTSRELMRQFANTLTYLGAPEAALANGKLAEALDDYGNCALSLSLGLTQQQCSSLFLDAATQPRKFAKYLEVREGAELTIFDGLLDDPATSFRPKLLAAGEETWQHLIDAGAFPNQEVVLKDELGMTDTEAAQSFTDVITTSWWCQAMADYSEALKEQKSLEDVGKKVVEAANFGFDEPWMILAAWTLAGKPAVKVQFATGLPNLKH